MMSAARVRDRHMRLFPNLRRGGLYLLPLAVLLIAISARIVAPDLLDRLSLIAFDLYQRALPRVPGNSPIRIVDIDDQSLAKIGQWPWPRTIVARLVERLATARRRGRRLRYRFCRTRPDLAQNAAAVDHP